MKRRKRSKIWQLSNDEFAELVKNSSSVSEILRKLSFCKSSFKTIVARISEDGLDCSHFERVAHNKGVKIPLSAVLVEHSTYNRYHLKNRLLKDKLLENKCEICGLEPIWQGKPMVLILDHKNGIRDDARLENLRFLCPNCNSQTETFAGRNGGRSSKVE